jgi:acyl-CoA synthetase (NDP forming)
MKLRQDEESEYARYAQNFNKLNKRPQEFLEKDRKSYILDKEVGSPHARIEEINQMVNNLKQETLKQISSAEVIPLGCANTLMDPAPLAPDTNAIKRSANDPHKHDTDASKNMTTNEDTEGLNAQHNDAIKEIETETSQEVKDGQNKSGMINQKEDTEIMGNRFYFASGYNY